MRPPPKSRAPELKPEPGMLYRVRDRHEGDVPGVVWGDNLTWDEATTLKNQVLGSRKSTNARLEPMNVPMPGEEAAAPATDLSDLAGDAPTGEQAESVHGTPYEIGDDSVHEIPADGYISGIPPGHELLLYSPVVTGTGNDYVVMSVPVPVAKGNMVQARPMDPAMAAARAAALAAARPAAAAANARVAYRDKTVVAAQPRTAPVPRDKTVAKTPPLVRLGAPPAALPQPPKSPLKVATELDGDELPDDAITDADLHDLDVGGGPSAADVAHAERERDAKGA